MYIIDSFKQGLAQFKTNWGVLTPLFLLDSLFLFKYLSPKLDWGFVVLIILYLALRLYLLSKSQWNSWKFLCVPVTLLLGILTSLPLLFPQASIQVDRWDAIFCWWDALFQGQFPYTARTRFDGFPSPLPGLQLLYLPGYLLGDLSYLNLIFMSIAIWICPPKHRFLLISTLVLSPAFWWEMTTRSTLLINSAVILLLFATHQKFTSKSILYGVLLGLILCSRSHWWLIWMLAYLAIPTLRNWQTLSCCVVAFASPLTLLYLWQPQTFALNNPFNHHAHHMPLFYIPILISVYLWGIWQIYRTPTSLYFVAGIFLWVLGFSQLSFRFTIQSFHDVFWGVNPADISYPIMCIPFLIYALIQQQKHYAHPSKRS